ncbi:MAG: pimeloyl-ACP methyl ester carboxylesterase [Candidatus Azotimanducaceae bacterium]|jgi:pimeloyl-ACP methyl ester carboxylesterase
MPVNVDHQEEPLDVKTVYWVSGLGTRNSKQSIALGALGKIYPNAEVNHFTWDHCFSDNETKRDKVLFWTSARNAADRAGRELAAFLLDSDDLTLSTTVLVGHSLGGRIVTNTLRALSKKKAQVAQAVLLGAAIGQKTHRFWAETARGSDANLLNFHDPKDEVLRLIYSGREQEVPIGAKGIAHSIRRIHNITAASPESSEGLLKTSPLLTAAITLSPIDSGKVRLAKLAVSAAGRVVRTQQAHASKKYLAAMASSKRHIATHVAPS